MTETAIPASDGNVFYSANVNRLATYTVSSFEAGPYTRTGDTNEVMLRQYTIGGGFTGTRLCFIKFTLSKTTTANAKGFISLNEVHFNKTWNGTTENSFYINPTEDIVCTQCIPVANGDIIELKIQLLNSTDTASIKDISIWCGDGAVTFSSESEGGGD